MKHKTMQGREIDMEKLMRQNETMPAIGNMRVNARGDELGPGGVVVRSREEVVAEYYETNPKAAAKRTKAAVAPVEDQPQQVAPQTKSKKPQDADLEE